MKNLFKSLMLVAVAAMAFTACTETNEEVNAVSKGTTITFNASFADETRVSLTDGDQDGVYQAAFEAGDHIMFAAYDQNDNMLDYTDEIILTEEQAANKDLTLTASFASEIGVGSKIKAFVNYYYDSYWERWVTYVNYSYQDAMVDSVENLNASAELVWNGEEFANIIFKHDNSFGKMTLVADGDVKFESAQITVFDGESNSKYANVVDEAQKVNNVFFFALNGEALNVSSMEVYAYDVDGKEYTFVKEFEPNQFHFKKGRVSKFTINKWYVALDMPEVNVAPSPDGTEVEFSWAPVANAVGYDVRIGWSDPIFVEGATTSYRVSLSDYNPFDTVRISVQAKAGKDTMFMDSSAAEASYTVPIDKNASGDSGFDFEYNKVEKLGQNWYKFSSTEHSYYMTLSFTDDDIEGNPAGQSKVYSTNDGTLNGWNGTNKNESLFTCQYAQSGYEGWFFQGDNMVFVDRLDNNDFEITAFCKRNIVTSYYPYTEIYPLFRGYWTGKLGAEETLATPDNLSATVQDGDVVVNWAPVANAEGYKVTLGNETKTVVDTTTATFENAPAGEWTIKVVATAKGYKDSEAATTTVTVEATVAQFTSATAVAADANNNYHFVTFTNGKDTAVVKIATRGTTEYKAGHYDQEGDFSNEDYLLLGGYATDNTWNGVNCWPVTMDVVDNGDGTATFTISAREYSGNYSQHAGTYTGKINGLTLYGYEPTIPEYTFTSASVTRVSDTYGYYDVEVEFTAANNVSMNLNFYGCGNLNQDANYILEGTYSVGSDVPCVYSAGFSWININDEEYPFTTGTVTVAEVDGQYSITLTDIDCPPYVVFNGSFLGQIDGLVVPSAYEEPEVSDSVVLDIKNATSKSYGDLEMEVLFWHNTAANTATIIDFKVDRSFTDGYIPDGTYSIAGYTLDDTYCKHNYGTDNALMSEATAVVTNNPDGTTTFVVDYVSGGVAYSFTYTGTYISKE